MANWLEKVIPFSPESIGERMALIDRKIYFFGAYFEERPASSLPADPTVYDIITEKWDGPGIAAYRFFSGSGCFGGGKLFLAGYSSYSLSENRPVYYPLYMFDTKTSAWKNTGYNPELAGLPCIYVNGLVYMFGGSDEAKYRGYDKKIRIYNTITNSGITLTTEMPYGRFACGLANIGNKIYLIGGVQEKNGSISPYVGVDIYDIDSGGWSRGEDSPSYLFVDVNPSGAFGYNNNGTVLSEYEGEIYCLSPSGIILIYNPVIGWRYGIDHPKNNFENYVIDSGTLYTGSTKNSGNTKYLFSTYLGSVELVNAEPSAGFVNEKNPSIFSWSLITRPAGLGQASATFQWRSIGSSAINSTQITGRNQSITVPGGTFPNGSFEWRVRAMGENGEESNWSSWHQLTTIDQVHLAPTSLLPSGGKRNGTQMIQFSWIANSPLGTPPSAFEIQQSYDKGQTWAALSGKVTSSNNTFILSGGTLPAGTFYWRVRTYNSDNAVSPWSSSATFIVLTAPDPPKWVSVEQGKSRPICKWISDVQIGWQIQALRGEEVIYDSEEQPGADQTHKIQDYLANGQYRFQCRILNELSLWSDWAERSVSINFRERLRVTLTGQQVPYGAQLDFEVEVKT